MINKVILIGNLGKDPEVRRLESGSVVAVFSLATNENYRDKEGNWQTQTEWHNIVVWRDLAERAEKLLKKGATIFLEGKLTHRKYTDSNNMERYMTEVVANNFRLLDKREGGTGYTANLVPGAEHEPANYRQAPASPESMSSSASAPTSEAPANNPMPTEGDDLPF